jgi:hypothetical protein
MTSKKPSETDLYAPIRDLLEQRGYEVRGEVESCDIAATKGDELVVVELKLRFSVDLLAQACDRLRITDSVYVAIPKPTTNVRGRKWRRSRALLRRLEVGLLLVDLDVAPPSVEIILHPLPYQRQRSKKRERAMITEMAGRSGDYNEGGSIGKELMTAYREAAIYIACALEEFGPQTAAQVRKRGAAAKAHSILYSNFYGWFNRVARGVYAITPQGAEDIKRYGEFVQGVREQQLHCAVAKPDGL